MSLKEQWKQLRERDCGRSEWPVYVTRNSSYPECVALVYRFKHDDKPKEWYVVELDNSEVTAIKEICK